MADDTTAALVAQLDVKFDALASNMKKAMAVFDNGGRALEKRQAQIKKNLSNWAIDFSGLGGINKALVGLTAAGIVGGIGALVKTSLDAASAIGDTAQQAGVGVEFLQKLRFAASQSGASFDIMDTALTTLNKSLGDFVQTGAGKGAAAFKALGIDKLINSGQVRTAEDAFNAISKGITKFGSEAQKSSILAGVFGKEAGPKLLQLMNQGAAGIADLEAKAVSLGIVLSTDTVAGAKEASDKLDALFSVIKAQGVSAVASLAPEIANLADQITKGLPDLITWVEKWAAWFGLIKLSPGQQLQIDIGDTKKKLNDAEADLDALQKKRDSLAKSGFGAQAGQAFLSFFTGGALGTSKDELDVFVDAAKKKVAGLKNILDITPVFSTPAVNFNKPSAVKVGQSEADIAKAKALAQKRAALLAQTGVDAATAGAALLVAQDQTSVQLLKGSADYYAAVKKQIDDEYQAKVTTAEAASAKQKAELGKQGTDWKGYAAGVENINKTLNDKIAAADEERKQKQDAAGPSGFIRDSLINGDRQIQQYTDETAALGLLAGAAAKLAYVQGELNAATEAGLTLSDKDLAKINAKGDAIARAAQANHDAAEATNDNIQVTDSLRSGLEDIGAASLHGFGSMKDAAKSALEQIAELILRLYVLKPLVESMSFLGPAGTPGGGGLFGGLLGSIFGGGNLAANTTAAIAANPLLFASGGYTGAGGVNQPAGIVHKGEVVFSQADVARLGGVGSVEALRRGMSIPTISAPAGGGGGGPTIIQQFDLRGAVVTEDLYAKMNATAAAHANAAVSRFNDKVLPSRVASLKPRQR